MKSIASIKLKAAFVLVVFSLNTVAGFACSLGLDLGNHSTHHRVDGATAVVDHNHKDGKKHTDEDKKESKSHNHDQANNTEKSKSDKEDNCCTNEVMNFQKIDKLIPTSVNIIHPFFVITFVAVYYNITSFAHTNVVRNIRPFVRSYHPPIPDIRIAIQSFLI